MKRRSAVSGLLAAIAVPRISLRAQSLTKVRMLALAVDQCGALFYAKELGMFEKNGLDVDISLPQDYGASISATIGGSADISYGIIVAIEQAFKKGLPVTIIAPAAVNDARHPNNYFLVPKDSPIKQIRDLNGKTLGTSPLKNLGTYAVEAWLNMHGGDATTIKWADIPFPLCAEAMARGRIDGSFIVEPFATAARATTRLLGRPYEAIAPMFLGAAYFTTPAWATAHPDVVRRFEASIKEASLWGNANHEKSAVIIEKYSKVDAATLAAMTRSIYAETLTPEILQPSIDFCARNQMIDASFPARELIYRV